MSENIESTETTDLYLEKISEVGRYADTNDVDLRFIGSVGRSAALGVIPDFEAGEFGWNKDLDVSILDQGAPNHIAIVKDLRAITNPIAIEEHFYPNIIYTGNFAAIRYRDIVLPVDPVVFSPFEGTLGDQTIKTYNPRTLLLLTYLYGSMRPKDLANIEQFKEDIRGMDNLLPQDLFWPFIELNYLANKHYPEDKLLGALRWGYHTYVSQDLRKKVLPVTREVWNKLKR